MRRKRDPSDIREVVGVFFDSMHLEEAIDDLVGSGFDRAELGLLAGEFTVRESLGDLYARTNENLDSPDAPRTAFVAKESVGDAFHGWLGSLFFVGTTVTAGAVVASAAVLGGGLLAAISGAAVVGAVGAAMALIIHQSDAEYLEEQVDQGHLLLFVRTHDKDHEDKALTIMSRHAGYDAKVYSVAAVETGGCGIPRKIPKQPSYSGTLRACSALPHGWSCSSAR